MISLAVRAHAKVNLDLRILARRSDGYRDLRTLFQSLSLHDRLTFRARRGPFAIASDDRDMPRDASNLVWRAAQALWTASGRAGGVRGVEVSIDKRIPAQAGLGGGSSDAAATLVALNGLWRAGFDAGDLARLGTTLGADVPYFLVGGTALGLGRGETLYPLPDVPSMGVLVVKPSFGVSTADAYGWYAAEPRPPSDAVQALAVPWYPGPLVVANDLERPVMSSTRSCSSSACPAAGPRRGGVDVGQRLGRLRPVPDGCRRPVCGGGAPERVARRPNRRMRRLGGYRHAVPRERAVQAEPCGSVLNPRFTCVVMWGRPSGLLASAICRAEALPHVTDAVTTHKRAPDLGRVAGSLVPMSGGCVPGRAPVAVLAGLATNRINFRFRTTVVGTSCRSAFPLRRLRMHPGPLVKTHGRGRRAEAHAARRAESCLRGWPRDGHMSGCTTHG